MSLQEAARSGKSDNSQRKPLISLDYYDPDADLQDNLELEDYVNEMYGPAQTSTTTTWDLSQMDPPPDPSDPMQNPSQPGSQPGGDAHCPSSCHAEMCISNAACSSCDFCLATGEQSNSMQNP